MHQLANGICLTLSLGLVAGCGGSTGDLEGTLETQTADLMSGTTNVSDGIVTGSMAESETAAVARGSVVAVAYNSSNAPVPNQRCRGYSQIAMSYLNSASTWKAIHFPTSAGIAAFRGDPSIAIGDADSSTYRVWVSTLASSTTQWNAATNSTNCVSDTAYHDDIHRDKLCVIPVRIPKTGGGTATVESVVCTPSTSTHNYDGTAITAVPQVANGVTTWTPYLASWASEPSDAGTTLNFYKLSGSSLIQRANPLSTKAIKGHPIFVKGQFALIAPDSSGTFWFTTFNDAMNTWAPPITMGSGFTWNQPMALGMRGGKEYAAINVPSPSGPSTTYLFFRGGSNLFGMARQSGGGSSGLFQALNVSGNPFHPAVAVATIPSTQPNTPSTFKAMLTYWLPTSLTQAQMHVTWIGKSNLAKATETPCLLGEYWGDYDEMAVQNDGTASPTFWRFATDSTKTTCSPPANGDWSPNVVQHVSGFSLAPL